MENKTRNVLISTVIVATGSGLWVYASSVASAKKASYSNMYIEMTEISELLAGTGMTFEYGSGTYDVSDVVQSIRDSHPDFEIVSSSSEICTDEVGKYEIEYNLSSSDKYGQRVTASETVMNYVEDTQAPTITLSQEEVSVYADQEYDVSNLVEIVLDPVDGELELRQENDSDDISNSESELETMNAGDDSSSGYYKIETEYEKGAETGEYEVTVVATDKNGLVSQDSALIKVITRPVAKSAFVSTVSSNTVSGVASSETTITNYDTNRIYIGNYTAILYYGAENQLATDAVDSAIYYSQNGLTIVADHASQGFGAMLSYSNGVFLGQKIHKVSTHYGTVSDDEKDIYYDDGGSFLSNYDAPIVMYTCIGNGWMRRAVTYWDYDQEHISRFQ